MNSIFYLSIVMFIICIAFISYALFLECKKQGFMYIKKIKGLTINFLAEYADFGMGVGASVSGFTLVELAKNTTEVSSYELAVIFFLGVFIFRLSKKAKELVS